MARALSLDRGAKRAIGVLVLVILAVLGMTAWKSVVALTPESAVALPSAENEDEIIQIGSHALLLEHGSTANRIVHWLHAGSRNSKAFELGSHSFAAHSAALNAEGAQRVLAIANMMTHVDTLDARIFLESTPAEQQLEELRATQIRGTLIADGVSPGRIAVSGDPIRPAEGSSKEPEVVVVLTA